MLLFESISVFHFFISRISLAMLALGCFSTVQAQGAVELDSKKPTTEDLHYPPDLKFIRLPAARVDVAFFDDGSGPYTLIFLHGAGMYLPVWKKNLEALRKPYRCIALDLPGHGKSVKQRYEATVPFYVNVVKDFIETIGLKNVVLVGHAEGAQLAAQVALLHPKLVQRLVLIAPTGIEAFTPAELTQRKASTAHEKLAQRTEAQLRDQVAPWFYAMPEYAAFMESDMALHKKLPNYGYYCYTTSRLAHSALDMPLLEKLPALKQPVLLLWGLSDLISPDAALHPALKPEDLCKQVMAKLPNSTYYILPGAGHLCMLEQPELTNKYIQAFLKAK